MEINLPARRLTVGWLCICSPDVHIIPEWVRRGEHGLFLTLTSLTGSPKGCFAKEYAPFAITRLNFVNGYALDKLNSTRYVWK